jgi:hypothetical protein
LVFFINSGKGPEDMLAVIVFVIVDRLDSRENSQPSVFGKAIIIIFKLAELETDFPLA